MYIGTTYIHAQNHALKAFTGLSKPDILLLHILSCYDHAIHYCALYDEIALSHSIMSFHTFTASLRNLVSIGYLSKKVIGNNALYGITTDGIRSIAAFNATLDAIVKDKIMKFGNGFNA